MRTVSFVSALFLTACVTINIYFPAAAAEKVADEIIKGIQAEKNGGSEQKEGVVPQSKVDGLQIVIYQWVDNIFNVIISPAHAEAADLSVNTAGIRKLRGRMQARFASLKPFYQQGNVGIMADGFLVGKGNISLKSRNKVKKLVAAENKDRQSLYQEIANANGHPEWFAQIKATFATRWVGNAKAGWFYQTSTGIWKKK
jgi:uncharacterized protein YdbL (DUF1318 family)